MILNRKIILPLITFVFIIISLLLAAILMPIDTKSVLECGEINTRYSLILGQKDEFEEIAEYSDDRLYPGLCLLEYAEEVNLYIL